jgi:hypothetical protein
MGHSHPLFKSELSSPRRVGAQAGQAGRSPAEESNAIKTFLRKAPVFQTGCIIGEVIEKGRTWTVLFVSLEPPEWMLIPKDKRRIADESDKAGKPDAVWIDRDATVITGTDVEELERMLLNGERMFAGDLEQTLGSRGRATGIYSPNSPPYCCGKRTKN